MSPPVAVRRRPGRGGLVVAAALGTLAATASGVDVAAIVLLAPAGLALLMERVPGRPMGRAMALFGGAAALPGLLTLWNSGAGMAAGWTHVLDPMVVARCWAAQAAAWLLCEAIPILLILRAEQAGRRDLERLRRERLELAEQWRGDQGA
jgi:hypothetical protein